MSVIAVGYTGWPKNGTTLYALTLPDINRFSKLFQCQNLEKICNRGLIGLLLLKNPPHFKCFAVATNTRVAPDLTISSPARAGSG